MIISLSDIPEYLNQKIQIEYSILSCFDGGLFYNNFTTIINDILPSFFHPYPITKAVIFCNTFHRITPPKISLATCILKVRTFLTYYNFK